MNEYMKMADRIYDLENQMKQLEKENADLQSGCRTCVYTDSPCVRSDYPSKDGVCSHYKNVFDENTELTEQNKHLYNDLTMTEAENTELKKENKVLAQNLEDTEILNKTYEKRFDDLEKENAELRKVAEFQQSSNMSRHFENKKLKEGLVVGSTFNKALNSMNKNLEEERDKYRNMVFDKDEQLTKTKELIKKLKALYLSPVVTKDDVKRQDEILAEAEQFLKGE